MKGMVFTEFIDFVTDQMGVEACEAMIDACDLTDGGAYTAVGTYPFSELVAMITHVHQSTQTPVPDLLKQFGQSLFSSLATRYPMLLSGCDSSFDLLTRLDDVIHPEVRKLHPDADLPNFSHNLIDANTLELDYQSRRAIPDLAEGLMRGCFDRFGEKFRIERESLDDSGGGHVRFRLTRE